MRRVHAIVGGTSTLVQGSQPGRRGRGAGPFAFLMLVARAATLLAPAAPASAARSAPRTVFFPTWGHTVDGLFLDAWRGNPSPLGLPISEELPQRVPSPTARRRS